MTIQFTKQFLDARFVSKGNFRCFVSKGNFWEEIEARIHELSVRAIGTAVLNCFTSGHAAVRVSYVHDEFIVEPIELRSPTLTRGLFHD